MARKGNTTIMDPGPSTTLQHPTTIHNMPDLRSDRTIHDTSKGLREALRPLILQRDLREEDTARPEEVLYTREIQEVLYLVRMAILLKDPLINTCPTMDILRHQGK